MPDTLTHDTAVDTASARLDAFRERLDAGVEHHVAQVAEGERIVASLRLQPTRSAPLRRIAQLGLRVMPDDEGALASFVADPDDAGRAGLALVMRNALVARRRDASDAYWVARCPKAMLDDAVALGWRRLGAAAEESAGSSADDPADAAGEISIVLLLDDPEHLRRLGSTLAEAIGASPAGADLRRRRLVEAFGLDAASVPAGSGALQRAHATARRGQGH